MDYSRFIASAGPVIGRVCITFRFAKILRNSYFLIKFARIRIVENCLPVL